MHTGFARSWSVRQSQFFNDLKQVGKANEFSYAIMACLYKKIDRLSQAIEISKEMQELGFLTDQLSSNNVLGLYAAGGRLREATKIFQQMLKAKVLPDDVTYKTLGTILKKGGLPLEAVNQLETARESGIPHSMPALIVTLYSMAGMHKEALEACEKLKEIGQELNYNSQVHDESCLLTIYMN
jgi:pentatricopeptide repeat protein